VQGAEGVLQRDRRIGEVELVEVEAVGPEPAEAGFRRLADVIRTGPLPAPGTSPPNLVATLTSSRLPLRARPRYSSERRAAVDVGGVEERDAGIEGGLDDRRRLVFVAATPEIVASEANQRDVHFSDLRHALHPKAGRPTWTAGDQRPRRADDLRMPAASSAQDTQNGGFFGPKE